MRLSLRSAASSCSSPTVFSSHTTPATSSSSSQPNNIFLSHHSNSSLRLQPAEHSVSLEQKIVLHFWHCSLAKRFYELAKSFGTVHQLKNSMSWPRLSFWRSGAYSPMWPIKEQSFLETYLRHQEVSLHLVGFFYSVVCTGPPMSLEQLHHARESRSWPSCAPFCCDLRDPRYP